jgi:uncharacterized protein involved in oxidation of intracellular sulfur
MHGGKIREKGSVIMKLGIIIYSNDVETISNAFKLSLYALKEKDSVNIFMMGKAVECKLINTEKFKLKDQMNEFKKLNGELLWCTTCADIHGTPCVESPLLMTTMDLYKIIKENDKVLTF